MTNEPKKKVRRYDLDWLRVFAVCLLIVIHTAAMFNPNDYLTPVKGRPSFLSAVFSAFVHEWRLSILFIVSGAGSYFALRSLSATRFARSRFWRLVIPILMGTLLLVPIHHYCGLLFGNPAYAKTYPQFYAKIIGDFVYTGRFGMGLESLHWAHLWFLAYLFVSSLLALPLFVYLRRESGRRLIERLADVVSRRWMIFLFALPLVVVEATLRAKWFRTRLIIVDDWASFLFYLVLFIYGFIIISDERISDAIERHRKSALLLGIFASTLYLIITFTGQPPARGYSLRWTLLMTLRGFNVWFWCVAILGFGSRYLKFDHKILPYVNEAVYPVYVLHLPLATLIAYWVVRWNIWAGAQMVIITLGTLVASLCGYELIRRTNVTRFLFGLKSKRRSYLTSQHPAALPPSVKLGG
jgi:peptidoglycan/LPS O-acetylase OafA/YrhL